MPDSSPGLSDESAGSGRQRARRKKPDSSLERLAQEAEFMQYMAALKAEFVTEPKPTAPPKPVAKARKAIEKQKPEPYVHAPLDNLRTELAALAVSDASLESKLEAVKRVEREYREQQEEEAIVSILMDF